MIAGGGLAGAAAAIRLARGGHAVTLLERERGPAHKVCGEFLSGEALDDLASLGVDASALGAAPVSAMRLVHRGRVAQARLPFRAAGLSRYVLDEALLHRAAATGADVHRGVRVRSAAPGLIQTEAGALAAPTLLLATGKHELRGLARQTAEAEPLIGFKLHLRLAPPQQAALAGHVEIILFAGGYAGLQMVENGLATLCLLVNRARWGGDWPTLRAALEHEEPYLARRLDGAVSTWERPMTIFRVPYGYVESGPAQPGVFRLGDQAAVIPSFCGDGMAIALHSARLAAQTILAGQDGVAYARAIRQAAGPPVRRAHALYRAAQVTPMRGIIISLAQRWPGLLQAGARLTRVYHSA